MMDKQDALITGATLVVGQKSAVGGSVMFSSMVIFDDPAYIIIGLIGALVSVSSEYYDILKLREEAKRKGDPCCTHAFRDLAKAFIIGLLFTMLSFMFFMQSGEAIIERIFGVGVVVKLLPSFWMITTIYLSSKSIAIYNSMSRKMGW